MVNNQGAVGAAPDVELDPVGSETAGLAEGFQGVFRLDSRSAPMGEHGDHATFSQDFRNEILAVLHGALYDLKYMR
jgi:hypothetical protein